MGAGAHCDARTVDDGRDIVRMGGLDLEGRSASNARVLGATLKVGETVEYALGKRRVVPENSTR